MTCKYCSFEIESDRHDCPVTGKTYNVESDGSGKFFLSLAIAAAPKFADMILKSEEERNGK